MTRGYYRSPVADQNTLATFAGKEETRQMPKPGSPMFVLTQLALNIRSARLEEERWQDLGERCHDVDSRRQIEAHRDECEQVQDAALDYLVDTMDAFERASDTVALSALKREPTYAELKVRPIRQAKTPTTAMVSA